MASTEGVHTLHTVHAVHTAHTMHSHPAPGSVFQARVSWWHDRSGAVSVEYGLILVMVVLVITGAISTLGSEVFVDLYTRIAEGVRGSS